MMKELKIIGVFETKKYIVKLAQAEDKEDDSDKINVMILHLIGFVLSHC